MSIHISEVKKTAENLASADLHDDPYHQNIKQTAQQLVAAGMGDWHYGTSYASGNTSWYNDDGTSMTVTKIETIEV